DRPLVNDGPTTRAGAVAGTWHLSAGGRGAERSRPQGGEGGTAVARRLYGSAARVSHRERGGGGSHSPFSPPPAACTLPPAPAPSDGRQSIFCRDHGRLFDGARRARGRSQGLGVADLGGGGGAGDTRESATLDRTAGGAAP